MVWQIRAELGLSAPDGPCLAFVFAEGGF
jgi:hypothetical protein